MNIYKSWLYLFPIFDLFLINYASIQLYNTEDALAVQSYDCIYYNNVTAANNETTPYCIRTNQSVALNRALSKNSCENSGEEWTFQTLKEMNVSQDEVLTWRSSIEIADRYAAYLTSGHEEFANDMICNCSSNTFGKFCEYQFMTKNTFENTIQYQFHLKAKYQNGSQLWGNITCYTTLTDCYFGLRCLTWQNICDDRQQCMDGIDEDHCEELEYNECEENEYRCQDGSCIPEQYWLDGQYDCSDNTDEQRLGGDFELRHLCSLISSQFICDEAKRLAIYFACGDGEFIRDDVPSSGIPCYNYRNMMYFCEFRTIHCCNMWTLENGHCVEQGRIEKKLSDMDELEQCVFYLKCKLTDGRIIGCDEVIDLFHPLCKDQTINYPSGPFFKPYVQTAYQLSESESPTTPTYVFFNGSIKCLGYHARSDSKEIRLDWTSFQINYLVDTLFCDYFEKTNVSGPQIDKNCWNDTKQSFLCQESLQCISKHRLRDLSSDCHNGEDEHDSQQCYMKKQHRLNCSAKSPLCLMVSKLGIGGPYCERGNHDYITQLKWTLFEHKCTTPNSIECNLLKTYIQSPLLLSITVTNSVLLFRQYCDTLWHLPRGFDESLCKKWKCPSDQYQCLSGHCVSLLQAKESTYYIWRCPDASDAINPRIAQLSEHNAKLISHSDLESEKAQATSRIIESYDVSFTALCNQTIEYRCILANVNDPLNFTINRPCINATQIGDGIIDCYGGLDERDLLMCGNNINEQRGFDFHCSDQECIPYHRHCKDRCSNNADSLLCDQLPTLWNSSCQYPSRDWVCGSRYEYHEQCGPFNIATYYCDPERQGKSGHPYRGLVWSKRNTWTDLLEYPLSKDTTPYHYIQPSQPKTIKADSSFLHKQENNGQEGWICGRGVAIRTNTANQVQCFCPPSLYGQYCQYFSDRITIIISLDNIPTELLEQHSNTIKILALLLSNHDIIDQHVFHLSLVLSKELNQKFRFNLIHSRPKLLLNSCTIRFEAYHLGFDASIKFLGVWEYPVHFPFLPSYRMVQILRFEKESTVMTTTHICKTANPCLHNSTCHPMMNKINQTSAFYCYCNNQTFGKYCEHHQQQPTLLSMCSKHTLLRPLSSSKSMCLCPSHLYGPTCHLNHTCVNKNPCDVNRGKCYINPDNITQDYICVCDKKFFGDRCKLDSAMVRINFTDFSFVQTPSNFILSSVIQLGNLHNETLDLMIREKRVCQGLPPSMIDIYHNHRHLPTLGVMKLYHKHDLSNDYVANLKQPDYFLLYIISPNISRMNLTLAMNMTNYCPYTPTIFRKNISNASYLSQFSIPSEINMNSDFNGSTIIFEYHTLCDERYSLTCFRDNHYFCLCDMYDRAECSRYDSILDQCYGRCRAGGECIHGDEDDRRDFICLCPRCYYGSICQHNTELFSFTLETLLTNDLYSPSVALQHLFFSLLIIIPFILFLIGAVNNMCCYVTFNRPKPLLVGIGHYLRTASIINQVTLLMLLLKLLHLVLTLTGHIIHHLINTILCKVVSYFLVCTSRMSYWLMGMVAIERVYVTWRLRGTWLKNPRIAKRIIGTIIIGIVASDVHELIYYQSIADPKSLDMNNSTWCVTSYPSAITTYNQVNIILNYVLPLLINLLSTIILIVLITKKRAAAVAKKTNSTTSQSNVRMTFRSYINLLTQNRELILAPLVTIVPQLFALPQFILSFSLACQEFDVNWQRYLLIISYFVTFLPQVLSYKLYVSPSSFYTAEFHATKFSERISRWRAFISRKWSHISLTAFNQPNDQIVSIL